MTSKFIFAVRKSLLLVMLACVMSCVVCIAQESSTEQNEEDNPAQVYLNDADGQPVAVPRLQYEQFADFLQKQAQATQDVDGFAQINSIDLNGQIDGNFLKVDVKIVAEIKQSFESPVPISIYLSEFIYKDHQTAGDFQSRIVTGPAKSNSNSDADPDFDSEPDSNERSGLTWEILPPPESNGSEATASRKECRIALQGYLPIKNATKEIHFDLPSAPSTLRIKLPKSAKDIQWSGSENQKLSETKIDNFTEVERIGLANKNLKLSWQDSGNVEEKIATEVTSVSRLQVNMEGRPWTATTRISLKPSSISSAKGFVVVLPKGSSYTPVADSATRSNWTITQEPKAISNNTEPNKDGEIRLKLTPSTDETTTASAAAEIRWSWQPPSKLDQDFGLQTVSIEEVDRHEGTLELLLPPQIQFTWQSGENGVLSRRLIESGTPELFNYVFSFSKTPLDVVCRMRESGYRLQYRPEYFAEVKDESIELTGFLNFAVDPSLMVGLEINLGAWTVKDIRWAQSGQPIDYEQSEQGVVRFDPAGLYRRNDSTTGATLSAGRTIQATLVRPMVANPQGSPVAQIDLPTVAWLNDQGQSITEVGNGWLVVATNEWLVDKPTMEIQALTPVEEIPTNLNSFTKPIDKNERQAYLFTPQDKLPLWKSELKRKPNLATQSVDVRVDFDQTTVKVQKTWSVGQNKWSDLSFLLCVPESIATDLLNDNLDVPAAQRASLTMDGKRVLCQRVAANALPPGQHAVEATASDKNDAKPGIKVPEGWSTIQPVLGEVPRDFVLKLEATAELPKPVAAEKSNALSIQADVALPFLVASSPILPIERHFEARVNSTWKANLKANDNDITILPGQTVQSKEMSGTLNHIRTTLEKLSIVKPSAVRINQIWLQTALNGSERRDRCVIDLTTASEQLELNLPNTDINNLTSVLINGQRVDPQRIEGTTSLILMLPRSNVGTTNKKTSDGSTTAKSVADASSTKGTASSTRYTVELWIWSTVSQRLIYQIDENLPRIANATEPAPKYWQVIVPQHDHLWTASKSLIPECQWAWSGFTLERTTHLQQAELERLTHASEQAQFGLDANRYLFSSLATTMNGNLFDAPQYIYIVPRFVLFGPVGLIAILVACLLVYFPSLRSIWMLGFGAALAIGVAAVSIDLAILLAQALAGALIVVAVLLIVRWSISRRVDQRSVFANRSRSNSRAAAPIPHIDFGSGESASQSDLAITPKKSNSAFGTTRSIQNGSDLDRPMNSQSSSDENAVEEAAK